MQLYDVIIIGGGPAGLACAHELSGTDLRVLLLEKNTEFGEKLCAGGLTLKDMELMSFPPEVLEYRISRAALHSRKRSATTEAPYEFLFTADRKELGRWQHSLLEGTHIEIRTGSRAVKIEDGTVTLRSGETFGFRYLVGADGYGSLVRRHLGLKTKKRLIGYQYNAKFS